MTAYKPETIIIPSPGELRQMYESELPPFNETFQKDKREKKDAKVKGAEDIINEMYSIMHVVDYYQDRPLVDAATEFLHRKGLFRHPTLDDKFTPIPDRAMDDFLSLTYEEAKLHEARDGPAYTTSKIMSYADIIGGAALIGGGNRIMMKDLEDLRRKFNEHNKYNIDQLDMVNFFQFLLTGAIGGLSEIISAYPLPDRDEAERIANLDPLPYIMQFVKDTGSAAKGAALNVMNNRGEQYFWGSFLGVNLAMSTVGHFVRTGAPLSEGALVLGHLGEATGDARKYIAGEVKSGLDNVTGFLYDAAKRLHLPVSQDDVKKITDSAGEHFLLDDKLHEDATNAKEAATDTSMESMNTDRAQVGERSLEMTVKGGQLGAEVRSQRKFTQELIQYGEKKETRSALMVIGGRFSQVLQGGARIANMYRSLRRRGIVEADMGRAYDRMEWSKYTRKLIEGAHG